MGALKQAMMDRQRKQKRWFDSPEGRHWAAKADRDFDAGRIGGFGMRVDKRTGKETDLGWVGPGSPPAGLQTRSPQAASEAYFNRGLARWKQGQSGDLVKGGTPEIRAQARLSRQFGKGGPSVREARTSADLLSRGVAVDPGMKPGLQALQYVGGDFLRRGTPQQRKLLRSAMRTLGIV